MRTHQDIIRAVGAVGVHDGLGFIDKLNTVRSWIQRDSIPAEHWAAFAAKGWASLEELAEAAAEKRRRDEGRGEPAMAENLPAPETPVTRNGEAEFRT